MPELPEVETVRRQLEPRLLEQTIVCAWSRLPRRTFPSIAEFTQTLRGARVLAAKRRGKQLYFPLNNGWNLLVHLGMTGRLFVTETPLSFADLEKPNPAFTLCNSQSKHIHAALPLKNGHSLVFADPRTFGSIGVARELPFLKEMGPEPIDNDFDEALLVFKLSTRSAKIKAAILDQKLVAGLGNIYADEVCFLANTHPATPACKVPKRKLKVLVSHMRPVLEKAIAARGATLKDGGYQDIFGNFGSFIPQVYGRTGEPCDNCGTPIQRGVLGTAKTARSYHYCPKCQKL